MAAYSVRVMMTFNYYYSQPFWLNHTKATIDLVMLMLSLPANISRQRGVDDAVDDNDTLNFKNYEDNSADNGDDNSVVCVHTKLQSNHSRKATPEDICVKSIRGTKSFFRGIRLHSSMVPSISSSQTCVLAKKVNLTCIREDKYTCFLPLP